MPKHARYGVQPTQSERPWTDNELIVTKTDPRGIITYANRTFLRMSQIEEKGAIGAPHNFVRHPDMPRCIFKLLWESVQNGHEIFAYIKNMATSGDFYWVFAHVTPTFDAYNHIEGYHSNRRKPKNEQIQKIEPIYKSLLAEEARQVSPQDGIEASTAFLLTFLKDKGVTYDEFVFSL